MLSKEYFGKMIKVLDTVGYDDHNVLHSYLFTIYNVSGISGMGWLYNITDEHDICWNDNGIGWDSDQFHCVYSAWLENGKNCLWCFWVLGYTWR